MIFAAAAMVACKIVPVVETVAVVALKSSVDDDSSLQ
jgi:hypothetical protein